MGTISGVVSTIFAFTGNPLLAGAFAANAAIMNTASAALAKPPPARGSVTNVLIAADPPSPYVMGEGYFGGVMRHDVAYGATLKKVPNPYRLMVTVYSHGGPVQSISPRVELGAIGSWYSGFLYSDTQLGACPEPSALAPNFAGAPGWGGSSKLSGQAAIAWNLKFDKDGKVYASGVPRFGAEGQWVKAYDPRKDSTFPGGSGSHRLGIETTYEWTQNPALHAGTYAYGRYQNGKRVMGIGMPATGIDWVGLAGWANVCTANSWTIFGPVYEPGNRWENLQEICAAGGGRAAFAGGLISWRYSAPMVALDTITDSDIAEENYSVTAMASWRDRLNTIVPKYISPAHDWQLIADAAPVTVAEYVAEDGEVKQVEWPFNLVKDGNQAAQLAAYKLMDSRELQPITLPCLPRLRKYRPGECLHIDLPELGLDTDAVILSRSFDPARMIVTLTLMGETPGKHDFALGRTATPPPTPALKQTSEERDNLRWSAMLDQGARTAEYDGAATYSEGMTVRMPDGSSWEYINAVPGSGNPPPTWPETSNAHWSILTPPLDRGKVFVQSAAPSAAESTGGDIWQDDDGRYWTRREDNHLAIGGDRLMIGGSLLTITWMLNATQPVQEGIAAAQAAADSAASNAATAQSAADAANAALADIASDSLLTPGEKPQVILQRDTILAEQSGIDAQATAFGITTEKTAYDNAVTALTAYLATLTAPVLWSDLTGNTTIVGATFRSKFGDVYATRQTLLNTIAEVAKAQADAALAAAATAQAAANAAAVLANDAQATADGKVTTFSQASPPTAEGVGDLWIDTDDGNKQYRWSGSAWVAAQDAGIGAALTAAAGAQATADGKVTTYYAGSAPTADAVGDLWFDTTNETLYRWSGSLWVEVATVGATAAQLSDIAAALSDAANAQATADGKIDSFYEASAPAGTFGDIWFDTDDGNKQYRHNGTTWVAVQDGAIGTAITAAAGAQATADGKVTTFTAESAPTAEGAGDLWFKESTGELRRWSGSAWGDPLVDLTAQAQIVVAMPVAQVIARDWEGNVKAGQLPRTLTPGVTRGGIDVRTDTLATYSLAATGGLAGKATVNNTGGSADKGRITLPDTITSGGALTLTVNWNGVAIGAFPLNVTTSDDNPPVDSGAAGGSDSSLAAVPSGAFSVMTGTHGGDPTLSVTIAGGETLKGNAVFSYRMGGASTADNEMLCKWQYDSGGGTWVDFASPVAGTTASYSAEEFFWIDGDMICTQTKAGLSAGTYPVRLVGAKADGAGGSLTVLSGTATSSKI